MTTRHLVGRRAAVTHHWGARRATAQTSRQKFGPAQAKPAALYSVGQVVRLKSGGRPMTITYAGTVAFAPGIWLICQWFSTDGELRQEMFHEEAVELTAQAFTG